MQQPIPLEITYSNIKFASKVEPTIVEHSQTLCDLYPMLEGMRVAVRSITWTSGSRVLQVGVQLDVPGGQSITVNDVAIDCSPTDTMARLALEATIREAFINASGQLACWHLEQAAAVA